MKNSPLLKSVFWFYRSIIPGVILALSVGVMSFYALNSVFDKGPLVSALYAIFAILATVSILVGFQRFANAKIQEAYEESRLTLEERRTESRKRVAKIHDDLTERRRWKNIQEVWGKAFIVFIGLSLYAWIMWVVYKTLPEQSLLVSWPMLFAFWFLAILFVPRQAFAFVFIALVALGASVAVLGPSFILELIPTMFMFPIFFLFNFGVMFLPMMMISFMQIDTVLPGGKRWGRVLDEVRGQPEAVKQIKEMQYRFTSGDKEFRTHGALFVGPPGTGKTLAAEGLGTELTCPIVYTQGNAFASPYMGVGILVAVWLYRMLDSLADEWGYVVLVIDEAEQLFARRAGVMTGSNSSMKSQNLYDTLEFDAFSNTGDVVFDSSQALTRSWQVKFPPKQAVAHALAMPGMGMGGASMALPYFLHKMDGVRNPPFLARLWREKVNMFLDVIFIPPFIQLGSRRINLRVPEAKASDPQILTIGLTNVPDQIDPAMLRPKRLDQKVYFVLPGQTERLDVADLYAAQMAAKGKLHPEVLDRLNDFASTTIGFAGAEIEEAFHGAPSLQKDHVRQLLAFQKSINSGVTLSEIDQRFWERYKDEIGQPDWDKEWVTWNSLMESVRNIRYGQAKPTRTSIEHRKTTAVHETVGHLLPEAAFLRKWNKPTIVSIMPRGQSMGMVASAPLEELDPQPQECLAAHLRMGLGSVIAERLEFPEGSMPGVVADMQQATRIAAAMVGQFAMVPYACRDEAEKQKYISVGKTVLSNAGATSMGMTLDSTSSVLQNPDKLEMVYLLLGQAVVDTYRLIKKNRRLLDPIIETLLAEDEIMGVDLEKTWTNLCAQIQPLDHTDIEVWPDELIAPVSPFYQEVSP